MSFCTVKTRVKKLRQCQEEEREETLLHICNCIMLIDGREFAVLRTVPVDLETLGVGYTIVIGYRPESVHIFQSSPDEYVINVLTSGKYEHPARVTIEPTVACEQVFTICDRLVKAAIESGMGILQYAYVTDRAGRVLCEIEDYSCTTLAYRVVGAVYRRRAMLEDVIVYTTCRVDKAFLTTLTALRLKGVITLREVTYDAVRYAQENYMLLIGNVDLNTREFTLYSGTVTR